MRTCVDLHSRFMKDFFSHRHRQAWRGKAQATYQYERVHMTLMDLLCECWSVAQTSIGTRATIEIDVSQPDSTSSLANQCTRGAAYRRSLRSRICFSAMTVSAPSRWSAVFSKKALKEQQAEGRHLET